MGFLHHHGNLSVSDLILFFILSQLPSYTVFLDFCEKQMQFSFSPAISCNLSHLLPLFPAQFPSLILPLSLSIRHLLLLFALKVYGET